MGNPFQDQLLKAGLVNKKQVNKAKQDKRVKRKKNKGKQLAPTVNKTREEQLAREKKNREENIRRNQEKLRQESLAQVRQIIETNRLDLRRCDDPYYFAQGKKIRKIYVDKDITKKLSTGALAIVALDDSFEVVPSRITEQILSRDPEAFVVRHKPEA